MKRARAVYEAIGKMELVIVATFISLITLLVFVSALARFVGHPLNWAVDLSLLLFAWVVFLGADVALRHDDFIRVDLLINRFPMKVQKFLYYLYNIMAIGFFSLIVAFGFPLAIENAKRLFQTLGISYSWATISAPIGSILLILTIIVRLIDRWDEKEIVVVGREAI